MPSSCALHEVVAAAGVLGVDVGAAEVLGGYGLADGRLDHGGTGQEGIGHLLDHDGFGGQVDDVGAARRVAARGERVLADAVGGHAAHVVEHGSEVAVVGEAAHLQGQVDSAGVGDVDAGQFALFGDGLGPHVLLQRDREIGARGVAVFVGEDHAVLAVDHADAGHDPPAGDMAPLLLLIDGSAVQSLLSDIVSGIQPQLEKVRSRVHEHPDEIPHRFLPLLRKPLPLCLAADVVRLFPMPAQKRVLLLPVPQIRVALPFQTLCPAQSCFCRFLHFVSLPKVPRRNSNMENPFIPGTSIRSDRHIGH